MLKRAVTRKAKIEAKAKEEKKDILNSIPDLKQQIENLHEEIYEQQRQINKDKANRNILSELYNKGYIDGEGNISK